MQYPSENTPNQEPKLLDQVRGKIRLKHYSVRTEQTYTDWVNRFILNFGKKHPRDMGAAKVERFLTHLAVNGRVSASTQNQAKCAVTFEDLNNLQNVSLSFFKSDTFVINRNYFSLNHRQLASNAHRRHRD